MKVIVAEAGEYEQKYVAFVAVSAEAALKYVQKTEPNKPWKLIDYIEMPKEPGGFTPYRVWKIESKVWKLSGRVTGYFETDEYELSEEEVIE